jgi:dCMP deaminase
MLKMAADIAERSTCVRRRVGCIVTDVYGRQLASSHNGVAMGQPHCTEHPCLGATCKSGEGLDLCEAIHAEMNCLIFTPDVMKIHTLYSTTSPCINCVKVIMNTSCERIVFLEEYPHLQAKDLWLSAGGEWEQGAIS